jgi:hypothetical protein
LFDLILISILLSGRLTVSSGVANGITSVRTTLMRRACRSMMRVPQALDGGAITVLTELAALFLHMVF